MLVIGRKEQEWFQIRDDATGVVIKIWLTEIVGYKRMAKIGIEAPDNFKVLRSELIEKENKNGNH